MAFRHSPSNPCVRFCIWFYQTVGEPKPPAGAKII